MFAAFVSCLWSLPSAFITQTCGRPAHCPPGFCDPYRTTKLAEYYRAKNGPLLMLGMGLAATVMGELFYEGHLPAYLVNGMTQHYSLIFPVFAALSFGLMGQIGLTFVGHGKPRFWRWLFGGLFVLLMLSALTGWWSADRLLSRIMVGAQTSITVGLIAVAIGLTIGVALGAWAAARGGCAAGA